MLPVVCRSYYGAAFRPSPRLIDLLPSDLNVLDNKKIIGGLGVQLLLFGGFVKQADGKWRRDTTMPSPMTLRDRLNRITPTWKPGGRLDYTYYDGVPTRRTDRVSVFGDALITGTSSVSELATTLEAMGLTPEDFDAFARAALRTMLSWRLPREEEEEESMSTFSDDVALFVFSFDATPSCFTVEHCPLPGPTNEMLAATAARFVAQHHGNVRIVAQWEVAAALLQSHGDILMPNQVKAVGTPGTFQNTAEIFELMRCALPTTTTNAAIVLAHPDHLRRAMRTAQTLMHAKKNHFDCAPLRLHSAMQPYHLDWPQHYEKKDGVNLFDDTPVAVHSAHKQRMVSWYDDNLGYFPDGDPQKWTHQREVWILYDHWAVAKGIVTGVIDSD